MTTATQKIAELQSQDIDAQVLDKYVEWFFNEYAPDDEYVCVGHHDLCYTTTPSEECRYCERIKSKARFHADLIQLVQRIYTQAQTPLLKQLTSLIPPPTSLFVVPEKKEISQVNLYCPACDLLASSKGSWEEHLRTPEHIKNVGIFRR